MDKTGNGHVSTSPTLSKIRVWTFIKQKKYHLIVASILIIIIIFFSIWFTSNGSVENNFENNFTLTTSSSTTTILPTTTPDYDSLFDNLIFVNEVHRTIRFYRYEKINLKRLFKAVDWKYKDKHFKELTILNDCIESIDEDILGNIRIDTIKIKNCLKLKYIHWNAFGNQAKFIIKFSATVNLTSSKHDLFKLINSMANCEEIIMNPFGNELRPIKLNKLKKLDFDGLYSSIKVEKIHNNAFYECREMELIDLQNNNINYISDEAFNFKDKNDKRLKVYLNGNRLNLSSFPLNSLANFKRPVTLNLWDNLFNQFDFKIFEQFFKANPKNTIYIAPNISICHSSYIEIIPKFKFKKLHFNDIAMLLNHFNHTNLFYCEN